MIAALAAAALVSGCQTNSNGDMAGTRFQELPGNIQSTARQQIGDAEIVDVDQERRSGSMVYEVTYAAADNNRQKIHIREDGAILENTAHNRNWTAGVDNTAGPNREAQVEARAGDLSLSADAAGAQSRSVNSRFDADADVSREAAGAEIKADSDTDIRSEEVILVKPQVRGGAEALTQGPSANLDARFDADADADLSDDSAGVEVKADTDLSDKDASVEVATSSSDVSTEAAGAEVKTEINTDLSKDADSSTEIRRETISVEPEARGGAKALTEGPSANLDAKVEADADVSNDSAAVEVKADTDVADKEATAEVTTSNDVSTDPAGAEIKAEAKDTSAEIRRETIQAEPQVRGGAQALTEGPSANLDAKVDADANADAASAEVNVSSEAAGAESSSTLETSVQPTQVRMGTLPTAVQNAIKTRGGNAQVSEINRKTVYEVKFADGQQALMVREDGTIVEANK